MYTFYFEEKNHLSDEELDGIRKELGVPDSLSVTVEQYGPYYWEAAERWYLQIAVYSNNKKIAGVDIDAKTGEWLKGMYKYGELNN